MKLRKSFALLLPAMVLLSCLSGCGKSADGLRLGTGGEGGTYYAYGNALAPLMTEVTGRETEVLTTTGSEANLRLLRGDLLDLAVVQSDTLKYAEDGDKYSAVAGIYTEACQIVVTKASGITSVADLAGKRVSIGADESGVTRNAEQILMASGLTTDVLQAERLSFADSAAAMERGEIDAFFCTAGAPTNAVAELAGKMDIRLLSIDQRSIDQLTSLYNCYAACTIPAGTYQGQTEDVTTLGVRAVLVAGNELDAATVEAVTGVLFSHNSVLQEAVAMDASLSPEEGVQAVPVPFHPGAADYYEKQGISVERWAPEKEGLTLPLHISLDMYQTLAIAVVILFLGTWLKKRIKVLETFCIPSPVVGGLVFAILSCILFATGVMEMNFDETLKNVCMIMFFTSVGFQANLKVLKSGGVSLLIFLVCVTTLIILQNAVAVGLSPFLGVDRIFGMCTGSIPMVGGHGTAGAFGPDLEGLGLEGATTLCTAAATFGLIAGSLMGGPLGRRLILKHDLLKTAVPVDDGPLVEDEQKHHRSVRGYAPAAYQIAIAMGVGTIVSWALTTVTTMNFPVYIGAMIVAAIMRNFSEFTGKFEVPMGEINDIGGICLSLFLGIAMITLKLWQLAALAVPLIVLLVVQAVLMFLFAYFVVFNVMGRNYDAAVLAAGSCGFGMGATPNAMANMQALTDRFVPSVKAYILVPIVGSMFADFINSITITFFINLL
ncbi:sodium/glutamate symporter [Colidextribacter sp. OB.20]|nr:sodium/glutamate symporter [Colidextribacter sp. OB.20]NBI11643.1 sodium/glutamate symporter [Colidextribacter sp. OB.20]